MKKLKYPKDANDLTKKQIDFVNEHLEQLTREYIEKNGNILDPDAVREVFYNPPKYSIAYNGEPKYEGYNVPPFRKAEQVFYNHLRDVMLDRAIAQGNTKVIMTTGCPGSGKGTALRNNSDLNEQAQKAGLVLDGAFSGTNRIFKSIKYLNKKGIDNTNIGLFAIYNDPNTTLSNVLERAAGLSKRCLAFNYFVKSFNENIDKIAILTSSEKFKGVNLVCIDNSYNNGGRIVPIEDAKRWHYGLTASEIDILKDLHLTTVSKGDYTPQQTASLNQGIEIPSEELQWYGRQERTTPEAVQTLLNYKYEDNHQKDLDNIIPALQTASEFVQNIKDGKETILDGTAQEMPSVCKDIQGWKMPEEALGNLTAEEKALVPVAESLCAAIWDMHWRDNHPAVRIDTQLTPTGEIWPYNAQRQHYCDKLSDNMLKATKEAVIIIRKENSLSESKSQDIGKSADKSAERTYQHTKNNNNEMSL